MTAAEEKKNDHRGEIRDYEQCGCQIGCGRCKVGRCSVQIFNFCNNTRVVLAFLSFGVFLQGVTVNGLSGVVISTLERRFHLRSSETGFISACYEIGVCISIPVGTYVGGRGHKPLWLGWGLLIMGLGSIVFSLPHFAASAYTIPDLAISLCDQNSTACDASSLRNYRWFFILGQIMLGIGASPLYTIALNYLDENVKEVYSSTYHGIFLACALLGPAVGFLLGGYFLSKFVNVDEKVSINPTSPFWVGNWWIGFLILGALVILVSFPIQMFPKQIPFTDKVRLNRENEMQLQKDALKIKGDENFGRSIRDLPRSLLIILKNPTLILLSISGAMDSGIVGAFSAFGAKYIEAMFNLSTSSAAIHFGVAVVITGCAGNLLSGILVTKLALTVPKMIKFSIVTQTCSFLCLFIFLLHCSTPDVAGVNVPYSGETNIMMARFQYGNRF